MRVLLGGLVAALALAVPQPASAQHHIECTPDFALVCVPLKLLQRYCVETKYTHCD